MRIQLREYIEFIRSFTDEVDVMSKSFFVIIPYTPTSINFKRGIVSLFASSKKSIPADMEFEEQRLQLEQRVVLVEQGLNRLGVKTATLNTDDLVELYYHVYNPTDPNGSAPTLNS